MVVYSVMFLPPSVRSPFAVWFRFRLLANAAVCIYFNLSWECLYFDQPLFVAYGLSVVINGISMIPGLSAFEQTLLGTCFTWGVTAIGAALVFVFKEGDRNVLDGSLGFAAGVMTAASFWSLLAPAIDMAERSGVYGPEGEYAFVPVAIGFLLGAGFVYGADILMPHLGVQSSGNPCLILEESFHRPRHSVHSANEYDVVGVDMEKGGSVLSQANLHRRKRNPEQNGAVDDTMKLARPEFVDETTLDQRKFWNRILLMLVAITVHNIPEGLAVGVGFGAVGKSPTATFESARNLALGIGIQNFPEGLAVSLPLKGAGMSTMRSFWYGQLSGMVEPVAGIVGCLAVTVAEPLLPYALAFAAGAMIFVVFDDIIPEAQSCGNRRLASWSAIGGFIVMMALDVGLG